MPWRVRPPHHPLYLSVETVIMTVSKTVVRGSNPRWDAQPWFPLVGGRPIMGFMFFPSRRRRPGRVRDRETYSRMVVRSRLNQRDRRLRRS